MFRSRKIEYTVAVASFIAAAIFAFVSLAISNDHEVAAGNCTVIAQFLLLTASIFGIDYKLNSYGHTNNKRNTTACIIAPLLLLSLSSCKSSSEQLSLSQIDSYSHKGTLTLFDSITISPIYIPAPQSPAPQSPSSPKRVNGGFAAITISRHATLSDSSASTRHSQSASQKQKEPSLISPTKPTFVDLFIGLQSALMVVVLYIVFKVKR